MKKNVLDLFCYYFFLRNIKIHFLASHQILFQQIITIGVEVTTSSVSKFEEGLSRASDITGKTNNELSKINKKNINTNKINIKTLPTGEIIPIFTMWGKTHDLKKSYDEKTKKLNSYRKFAENNLFVFAWIGEETEFLEDINNILALPWEKNINFDKVYVFISASTHKLLEVNLSKKEIHTHKISIKDEKTISLTAFRNVMGYDKE